MHARSILAVVVLCASAPARQAWLGAQEGKLLGADTNAGDGLGSAIAIDGDTLIVGAPRADPNERGAAYVFVRANGGWVQQAKLVATLGTSADFDHFGESVDIEGDLALVGAPDWGTEDGHVHVFTRSGTTWTAQQVLGPPTTGYFYRFGADVALSGDALAASAPLFGPQLEGAVAIYRNPAGVWTFDHWITDGYLIGPGDHLGEDIDLSPVGSAVRLIASTRAHGAATFSDANGSWQPSFVIGAPTIVSVAADGTTVVLGVPDFTVGGALGAGKVWVYLGSAAPNAIAAFQATFAASDASAGAKFGATVAVDGDVIVVGAPFDSTPGVAARGAAYVFERTGSTWHQRAKLIASDAAAGDHFGRAVAVAGTALIIGAPDDSNSAGAAAGSAYAERVGFPTVTYCTSGVSTTGCVATMSSTGTPSASLATPFSLQASNLDGQRSGLLFYGASGTSSLAWGSSSFLCVKLPLQRSAAQMSGGTSGACDGSLVLDWNLFVAQNPTALGQPFSAGRELWAQAWYRDPPSAKTTQLSNALGFVLLP